MPDEPELRVERRSSGPSVWDGHGRFGHSSRTPVPGISAIMGRSFPGWRTNLSRETFSGYKSGQESPLQGAWWSTPGGLQKIEVGVKMLEGQESPWRKKCRRHRSKRLFRAKMLRAEMFRAKNHLPRTREGSPGDGCAFRLKSVTRQACRSGRTRQTLTAVVVMWRRCFLSPRKSSGHHILAGYRESRYAGDCQGL